MIWLIVYGSVVIIWAVAEIMIYLISGIAVADYILK